MCLRMTISPGLIFGILRHDNITLLREDSSFFQEDKVWEWDRVFTEVASDIQQEWEKAKVEE